MHNSFYCITFLIVNIFLSVLNLKPLKIQTSTTYGSNGTIVFRHAFIHTVISFKDLYVKASMVGYCKILDNGVDDLYVKASMKYNYVTNFTHSIKPSLKLSPYSTAAPPPAVITTYSFCLSIKTHA